jgi:hypothetical protein
MTACLTSNLVETGMDANDCKCSEFVSYYVIIIIPLRWVPLQWRGKFTPWVISLVLLCSETEANKNSPKTLFPQWRTLYLQTIYLCAIFLSNVCFFSALYPYCVTKDHVSFIDDMACPSVCFVNHLYPFQPLKDLFMATKSFSLPFTKKNIKISSAFCLTL